MTQILTIAPLSKDTFAPFGQVIERDPATIQMINSGTTERYHALGRVEATGTDAEAIISLFRGQPRSFPYTVGMMERHPFGSQSFHPLDGRPWLVVVAEDHDGVPGKPLVFLAQGDQGINYRANVWHHPLIAFGDIGDFLVVDRLGQEHNLEKYSYADPFTISEVGA
jgi:ureidoglycolate lyase